MVSTCTGSDEEAVEDVRVGQVGYGHCDINPVGAVCQLWCLEIDDRISSVEPWLLGSGCNEGLSKR